MNKKGQAIFVVIMFAVLILIAVVNMIPLTINQVQTSMNSSSMNCTSTTIPTEQKITCTIMDVGFLFYFIGTCLAVAIAYVAGKKTITGVLTSIMVFIVTVLLITPLKYWIILARDSDHLYCTSATVSIGAKMLCIFVDLWLFYFIVTCIAAGITYIAVTKVIPEK